MTLPVARLTVVNALLIPVSDTGPDWFHGWLTVGADGRITGIGPGDPPAVAGEVLDAGGAMVAPGFVSAHSHLFTSGLRGIAAGSTLYPWVRAMMEVFAHADAEDLYWCTLHGALDFLANGVTSAYNFTQSRVTWLYDPATASNTLGAVHPTDYLTRQFAAAADAGIRVMNAIRLDDEAMPEDETLGVFADMVAASAELVPTDQHLGASVFGAVQWAAGPRTAQLEAVVMDRHGLIDQAHFVETAQGVDVQRAKFAWYADAGALGPRFLFGHFVHPTDEMVATAAAAGAGMVWQPTSNGRLGSGFADVVRLREAGMRVGIGLDDQSCTDISDPFANMRMGLYTTRALHTDAGILMPRDVLRMHTLGSAEVLGVADRVGSLEVGKFADFVLVDHRAPSTGPVWDVPATYVLACGLRNLKRVYVGGRPASVEGRCTSPLAADADGELHARITRAARAAGLDPAL
ncbi:amidohydrolase family protein [Pseudonocardia humida]|uniref:Amidohydrolase family protein n=1 Tax=Pseudonocardia humida TaxID=2800819 RepID=A0ABT1AC58_9PSEU|nr:amidohydrolase family protein [Pseudonocardia humida]MCO1660389.1 amidohydrolase family protein [Pseudonocardia humida]